MTGRRRLPPRQACSCSARTCSRRARGTSCSAQTTISGALGTARGYGCPSIGAAVRSPRFDAVYGRSLDDPDGFWGEAARAIDWHVAPQRVLDRDALPLHRWFPGGAAQHVPQRARPPRRRRPRRPAGADLRQPGDRHGAHLTYARAARRGRAARRRAARARRRARRPRHPLHADGARGGRRRCWPAPGSARSTRSSSAASRRTSWPCASTTPGRRSIALGLVRDRGRRASSPTSRCSTRRSPRPRTRPSTA